MTLRHLNNLKASIGEVIDAAGGNGLLVESEGKPTYALIPLDDELLDYLLERNPDFIDQCAKIRKRMHQGEFHTHDEVIEQFKDEP